MSLVSGTAQNGTWERTIVIPQGSATGSWTPVLYPLEDTVGNSTNSFSNFGGAITVTGPVADNSPPTLASWTFTPTTVDISTAAATVTARFTITDATAVKTPTSCLTATPPPRPSASAP